MTPPLFRFSTLVPAIAPTWGLATAPLSLVYCEYDHYAFYYTQYFEVLPGTPVPLIVGRTLTLTLLML